jgi:hypothetical protein
LRRLPTKTAIFLCLICLPPPLPNQLEFDYPQQRNDPALLNLTANSM